MKKTRDFSANVRGFWATGWQGIGEGRSGSSPRHYYLNFTKAIKPAYSKFCDWFFVSPSMVKPLLAQGFTFFFFAIKITPFRLKISDKKSLPEYRSSHQMVFSIETACSYRGCGVLSRFYV